MLEIEEVSKAYEQKDGTPLQVIDGFHMRRACAATRLC